MIYIALSLTGNQAACEPQTNHGYIDALVRTPKYIYVMGFKVGTAAEALAQIRRQRYFEKFLNEGKEFFLVGIGFDPVERNIVDWKVEVPSPHVAK